MISACFFGAPIEHPSSPVRQALADPIVRRADMGIAMGLTAVELVNSPRERQSGAHFNPSVTLTFYRLGKINPWDAALYVTAQFVGAISGVLVASAMLRNLIAHPSVNYIATLRGPYGSGAAFVAELMISFILMTVVSAAMSGARLRRFTGLFADALLGAYLTLEAPVFGMLLAAEAHVRLGGRASLLCAKLHHENDHRGIFCGRSRTFPKRPQGAAIAQEGGPLTSCVISKESL